MSFGVKANGNVVEEGSVVVDGDHQIYLDSQGFPLKQMDFYNNTVSVYNWNKVSLRNSSAPNAIVGKNIRARDSAGDSIGRTYLCALPYYNPEIRQSVNLLLVYSAKSKTQSWAESDLSSWGCLESNTVMMDGSHSRKLLTKGGIRIDSNDIGIIYRPIPQVIGIFN